MSSKSEGMTQKPGNGERSFTPHRSTMRPKVATVGLRARRSKDAGFTLIELMVILAIAVILAAVVGVAYVRKVRHSDDPILVRRLYESDIGEARCDEWANRASESLSSDNRKILAETYAEHVEQGQDRKQALEATFKDVETGTVALSTGAVSAERKREFREWREEISQGYDLGTDYTECFAWIERGAPSVILPSPEPTAVPDTPQTRIQRSTDAAPAFRFSTPTPTPAAKRTTPAPITQSTPPPPGVVPPHFGPPDDG